MNYITLIENKLKKYNINKKLTPDTKIKSLGIDSLDIMNLVIELETDLKITISDDDLMKIETVQDIVNLISKK